jgi:UbiD family decarboxylase
VGALIEDLRDWLARVEEIGELEVIRGADWDLEIGTLCEIWGTDAQALLFDEIPGYPKGWRVLTNALDSPSRMCLTLGLPPIRDKAEAVRAIREKLAGTTPLAPRVVTDGPVLEEVSSGADVNLLSFPTPRWHELDGGRFIGTGDVCITRDPDSGWVNLGTYRVQVHDERTAGLFIAYSHHGLMIAEKYWSRGKPCPIAVCVGQDPLLFAVSATETPHGRSEYETAGGLRGEPVEVVGGPATGLPIPARAEIVLEGEVYGDERAPEGPFGEWAGYYSGRGQQPRWVIHVKSVCRRRDPILLGAPPGVPPNDNTYFLSPFKSAAVWEEMVRAGVPGVTGVWEQESGAGRMFLVVAIRQMYPGHSKQALHVAAFCNQGGYSSRMVVAVDDDIDPTDLEQVMWAVCTRADLRDGLEVSHRNWADTLEPASTPADEEGHQVFNSRLLIDACRPWERRGSFPAVARNGDAVRRRVAERFAAELSRRRSVLR